MVPVFFCCELFNLPEQRENKRIKKIYITSVTPSKRIRQVNIALLYILEVTPKLKYSKYAYHEFHET